MNTPVFKLNLKHAYTYLTIPEITNDDCEKNIVLVEQNHYLQHLDLSMPKHIFEAWWDWLDKNGGNSDHNVISNQILAEYFRKQDLWNTKDSCGMVTKIENDDYTVVVHDKLAPSNALLSNFVVVPYGASDESYMEHTGNNVQLLETWEGIKTLYKKYCVAQNATIHDIGKENLNYEQRKYALEDLVFLLQPKLNFEDSLLNYLHYIEEDVNKQTWTRTTDKNGAILYLCLSDNDEKPIH